MFSIILCLATGVLLIFSSWFIFSKISKSDTLWKSVPRERKLGGVLAFIALAYSAYHGRYMLENGLEYLRVYVWVALPIVTIMVYLFLDYVFARALGGFLVVAAVQLTHQAFIEQIILRPLFSLNFYIVGTIGLFLIGMPWILRNQLERCKNSSTVAYSTSLSLLISGSLFIIASLL